jgi:ribulose-5-phosphate 4-epimerase/fuculose-1-phosphate aldolase
MADSPIKADDTLKLSSLKAAVSADEWRARVDFAAVYRLVALNGWDDLIYTHISAQFPGEPHRYPVNPWGVMFGEIAASGDVLSNASGTHSPELAAA